MLNLLCVSKDLCQNTASKCSLNNFNLVVIMHEKYKCKTYLNSKNI